MATQEFIINGGPSKLDLMLALFDGDCSHRRLIKLSLVPMHSSNPCIQEHEFILNIVERKDGSGERWMLSGVCTSPAGSKNRHMSAYYCTSDRHGMFKLD